MRQFYKNEIISVFNHLLTCEIPANTAQPDLNVELWEGGAVWRSVARKLARYQYY